MSQDWTHWIRNWLIHSSGQLSNNLDRISL